MLINYKKSIFFIYLILCSVVFSPAFAIIDKNDITDKEVTIEHKFLVNNIDFNTVLGSALNNSYDLQMADFDILISKYGINEAKSEYWPKIGIGLGTEYNKNFKDYTISSITVGDTFINPYTRFQTLAGITLNYNLFDFGVRKGYLNMAKSDNNMKKLISTEEKQNLTLTIVELYSRILILNEQIKIKKEILKLEENNLRMKKRLYTVNEISKLDFNDQNIKVERCKKEIESLYSTLDENLIALSCFTNNNYDAKKIKIKSIDTPNISTNQEFDYSKSVTALIHDEALKKKRFELSAQKRVNYPKINMYTKYYLYGSDPEHYGKSYTDFSPSNWALGASLSMMPFDGGKNRSKIKQLEIEVKKIEVEKNKNLAELRKKIDTLKSNLQYTNTQLNSSNLIICELTKKEGSNYRLLKNRLISPIDLNETKIELLEEKLDNIKLKTVNTAILKNLEVLTTMY